jgi:pimeloyl-ACP methyl ester carboxylesterase
MTEENPSSGNITIVRLREALAAGKPRGTHWLVQCCPWLGTRLLAELCLAPRVRLPALGQLPGVNHRELRVGKRSVRLHLLGEGPRVVLVHGWQGAASQMVSLAHSVMATGFSVALFDMPAHGETSGWSTSGVEFTQVLQHIGGELGPLHAIVGHSLGGTAALLASARGLPSAGVVALAPLPSFDFALRNYARTYGLPPRAKELLARRLEARTGIKRTEMDLARLRPPVPALLIHDLLDRIVPPRHSRRLRDAWPSARLLETLGLGHHRGLQTEHVAQAIVAFLLSLPGAG